MFGEILACMLSREENDKGWGWNSLSKGLLQTRPVQSVDNRIRGYTLSSENTIANKRVLKSFFMYRGFFRLVGVWLLSCAGAFLKRDCVFRITDLSLRYSWMFSLSGWKPKNDSFHNRQTLLCSIRPDYFPAKFPESFDGFCFLPVIIRLSYTALFKEWNWRLCLSLSHSGNFHGFYQQKFLINIWNTETVFLI